ncbi:MAG: bifunctional diguanylate cyclase/phosphodiesterase, partial [Clostridiales bacterium]|nr:bifunctional diguanylate cyclase/phosphodiesterase [Clostridiales bacterium]
LMENGVCNGFIGVDNPINFLDDFQLLSSVGYFTVSHIQKRRLIDNLEKLSYIDDLTQLFNRNKYIEDITELEKNIPESLGVVFLDLNGLKIANDKFGHDYGDVILKKVAKLLMRIFKKNHNIYRIGGDEFIIFSPNISKKSFYTLTERLRTSVGEGKDISASIGTTWGNNDYNVCDLIKHADDLMYANKQSFYHSAKFGDYNYSSLISKNLIKDIENGKYVVYLQPKIDLATDTLCGAEALIRGIGKDGKLIPPNSFIPVLESNGLIRHIDFFVFETACKLLNDFDKTSTDLKSISVNFSRVTLLEHGIVNSLVEICKRCHVSPSNIIIEVTESTTHLQVEELISLVYKIKDAGFNVSLDDYGTKYSNMIVLSNVGFDEIKLDRSMIRELTFNSKTKTIIEYTIKMLKELKKCNVVAEGIETPEELDLVKTYGCDLGQGFHFSRPISIEDFTKKYITD